MINNAIKYQKEDTIPKVEINVEQVGDFWEFSIKDNGIGISHDNIDKIFNLFYRANEARTIDAHTGSGIGLTLAKHIVKLHKGHIEVSRELDTGSTFIIHLPIKLNR